VALGTAPDIDQLSQAISHATAPAFMLGAVAAFLSILVSRLQRIADRLRALETQGDAPGSPLQQRPTTPLTRRAELLHHAIYLSVLSALATAALLILAFVCALIGINHRSGVALMFIVALALLCAALLEMTREVRLAMNSMHLE
jgi:Cu/Ag efflux pump CusA